MATLKQGTTRAKQIQKAHPRMKWTECIKLAHKQLGKKKAVGSARPKKKAAKKVARKVGAKITAVWRGDPGNKPPKGHPDRIYGTMAGIKSAGVTMLKEKYGKLATQKALAKGKRDRAKLQKQMTAVLSNLRKLKSI